MNELNNRHIDLSCQEYRSRLFDALLKRYTKSHTVDDIVHSPITILNNGWGIYNKTSIYE